MNKQDLIEWAIEITGTTDLLVNGLYDQKELIKRLDDAVLNFKNCLTQGETKRLMHKSLARRIYNKYGIDSERFDLSYTDRTNGYNLIMCHLRTEPRIKFEVCINYNTKIIEIEFNREGEKLLKEEFDKTYLNKGYEVHYRIMD